MTPRSFFRGPWPWIVAALVLAAYGFSRLEREPELEPIPVGGVEDILALKERSDLNVLFVLIDTLRAERLHSYGYPRPTSPLLDLMASYGVRFDRNLSQSSWTKCSMASLWTGLYPQHSGVTRFDDLLSEEARLPAEILQEAGFRTAGLWRNGWVEGYFGFDQGFDTYTRPNSYPIPEEIRRENPTATHRGTDMDLVRSAEEFLHVNGDERWFLYLHMMDVHEYTYDAESAKFGTSYSDIYDNAIHFTNRTLDILFGMLYEGGYMDDTLIVLAADHGEAFGERGLEGHARAVYRETTEVPLILVFPFRLQPGAVVRQRTANVDIWPTVLDLLGLPGLGEVDGRSRVPELLAAVRGEKSDGEEQPPLIAHLDTTWGQRVKTTAPMVSVVDRRFRYLAHYDAKGELSREELYDRQHDGKSELVDRLADEADVAERMREVSRSYVESEPAWSPKDPLEIDEMQLNQLRALGYQVP